MAVTDIISRLKLTILSSFSSFACAITKAFSRP